MVTDISRGDHKGCGQAAEDVHHHMKLGVKAAPGFPDGLILKAFRPVGVLMNLDVGAVVKDGFGIIATDHFSLKELEKTGKGEPVEKLINGEPMAEFTGQSPPCAAIEQDIPEAVEVLIPVSPAATRMRNVVVSDTKFLNLIF